MNLAYAAALLTAVSLVALLPSDALGKKKKKKSDEEPVTQVLELPKDPPVAVVADTRRLVFHTSPLSAKGLLSQQTRDALKALLRAASGASIVKLRAFAAGSGDIRRVQAIVSETFTERRVALPALSVVQVGGLPREGAQVVLESVSVAKKEVNPHGLVFVSGQAQANSQPLQPLAPLAEKAAVDLDTALAAARVAPGGVLRVTCFLSALDDLVTIRQLMEKRYAGAAFNYVQTQRGSARSIVECEAVARLASAPPSPVDLVNPDGLPKSQAYTQMALVNTPRVAFTGLQMAFGLQDKDARLAFQRLQKALETVNATLKDVVMASAYPLHPSIAEQVKKIRAEFYDQAHPPGSTMLPFEGLPSIDGSFGVEVVAALK
jgi:enamine deaminase RidA (YjgF/YER057c/UK114 family)